MTTNLPRLVTKYMQNSILMENDPLPTLKELCKYVRISDSSYDLFLEQKVGVKDILAYGSKDYAKLRDDHDVSFADSQRLKWWQQAYIKNNK